MPSSARTKEIPGCPGLHKITPKISVQMEVDFDCNLNPHGVTVFHSRFKLPILHSFDRFFIQAHAQTAEHADVAGATIGSDDQTEGAYALIFRLSSFFRKLWLWRINLPWRRN